MLRAEPAPAVAALVEQPGEPPVGGLPADVALGDGRAAFWGASALRDGRVDAAGGRVITVTALGDDVPTARANAYAAVEELGTRFGRGRGLTYRSDIAAL